MEERADTPLAQLAARSNEGLRQADEAARLCVPRPEDGTKPSAHRLWSITTALFDAVIETFLSDLELPTADVGE
ncbi:MAG: hypothetical protein AAF566_13470 [Pseudomonadota bacterium]